VRFKAPQSQDRTPASATPPLATNYRESGLVHRRRATKAAASHLCWQLPPLHTLPPGRSNCEVGWEAGAHARSCNVPHVANELSGQLQRSADAMETEMPARAFAMSRYALMSAGKVVSRHVVRPAIVAPSRTECTQPPTGRSRSGLRTTLASSSAAALCPIRTGSGTS
jgi:hypothetical protein